MAITQVASYTPTDRRPQAFALGSPAALEISNQTTMRLVVMVSRMLRDEVAPGDHKIYPGLNNLSVAPSWLLLSPDDVPDSVMLSGFLSVMTYGVGDPLPATGSYTPGSFTTPNRTAQDRQMLVRGLSFIDVKADFGAVGDGFTNDQPALQAAYDTARILGGARVHHPAGTYLVSAITTNGSSGAVIAALCGGANCAFTGDGAGATVIKFAANQPNHSYVFHNYTVAGGDSNMLISDLTIDGNADNQGGAVDAQYGCRFVRARGVTIRNCVFLNVFGTTDGSVNGPNGTAGEGFAQQFDNCADCLVGSSAAYATSASTSTGFASNDCTNVTRVGCISYGWGHGMGFTDWTSANVQHSGCRAYLCGKHGFNLELSTAATYNGCLSGGVATSSGAYPFTNGQSLGNTGNGFTSLGSSLVHYNACDGSNNGGHGVQHFSTPTGKVFVNGGNYSNNGGSGVALDANQAKLLTISGAVRLSANTANAVATGTTPASMTSLTGLQSAPSIPATGVALTNPFPVAMLVNVTGGTVTGIALDGSTITGQTAGMVRVGAGETITLTYSVAPAWQWFTAI